MEVRKEKKKEVRLTRVTEKRRLQGANYEKEERKK